ncbi:MAG: CheR family methyltransferase [Desulfovibrio sp.]|uniref:CheR family methyltransferase n=1 Tax=Desulfovibrio sp. 7SRBS1 TaxID=3378064 RepID=UPI003B3E759F
MSATQRTSPFAPDWEHLPIELADHLERTMGLDRESVGEKILIVAAQQRAEWLGLDAAAYTRLVLADGEESQRLIETVVVPETWFFRDVQPYVFLTRWACDHFLHSGYGADPIRILSVPSSTGEEPYSIAMAFLDAGFSPEQFHVDAWDISRVALRKAEQGVFGPASFRTEDLGFRDRHFSRNEQGDGGDYRIDARTRGCVSFYLGNLANPGFGAGVPPYHAIFCRNLLIYFTEKARSRAVAALERLLLPGGVLFTGHTEIMLFQRLGYVPVDHPKAFACRRLARPVQAVPPIQPPLGTVCTGAGAKTNGAARAIKSVAVSGKAVPGQAAQTGKSGPTGTKQGPVVPLEPSRAMAGNASPAAPCEDILLLARRAADSGRLAEAEELCHRHLADNAQDASAYVLLGIIRQAAGRADEAEKWLQKALYLDPAHYEALVHMSLLCAMRGDAGGEANFKRRAARCMPTASAAGTSGKAATFPRFPKTPGHTDGGIS